MSLEPQMIPQAAAIPVRAGQVCLVTSSNGKRWIIPKGMLDPGTTLEEIALQEAWEEAGLQGTLRPQPVGSYQYDKYGGTCDVTVFVMDVTDEADDWPERGVRRRRWLSTEEAAASVTDPKLGDIIRRALAAGG